MPNSEARVLVTGVVRSAAFVAAFVLLAWLVDRLLP